MELATAVAMDKAEAAQAAARYRGAFRETAEEPYRRIAEGYEALAEGVPLIDLPAAIRAGGADDAGRPRLAVCRANARVCFLDVSWPSSDGLSTVIFRADDPDTRAQANMVRVTELPGLQHFSRWPPVGALVPLVPPEHRPRGARGAWRGRLLGLRNYHVLWEVEEAGWQPRTVRRRYARDPALLRHVDGDLYAVLAVWEVTELERLVLEGFQR